MYIPYSSIYLEVGVKHPKYMCPNNLGAIWGKKYTYEGTLKDSLKNEKCIFSPCLVFFFHNTYFLWTFWEPLINWKRNSFISLSNKYCCLLRESVCLSDAVTAQTLRSDGTLPFSCLTPQGFFWAFPSSYSRYPDANFTTISCKEDTTQSKLEATYSW